MPNYVLSPYVHPIESHLAPESVRYAVFHQLTGEVFEMTGNVRNLVWAARLGTKIAFDPQDLKSMGELGTTVSQLIEEQFFLDENTDPFVSFLDHYAVRPIQNPAVTYRSESGELMVVRMSMAKRICSPARGELTPVIEEMVASPAAEILAGADGRTSLQEIFARHDLEIDAGKEAVVFLTSPERQLIKLTRNNERLNDPNERFNSVPRSLYHSAQFRPSAANALSATSEFHQQGIEDAEWEFDLIEPTVNHAFRFPSEALGGLSYGARFCASVLDSDFIRATDESLDVLEVGGGTGSFACSFIKQACSMTDGRRPELNYHILDLSPVLAANQQKLLAGADLSVEHFHQDAVSYSIPNRRFNLVIANEVIADFPTSWVRRQRAGDDSEINEGIWENEGAVYLQRYGLSVDPSLESFRLNSGVFEFIERSWEHLHPGGVMILTEYGTVDQFPVQILHLNHEEFSIHFGHVKACAENVGFVCRLLSLTEFLHIDEAVRVLAGNDQHIICLNHVLKRFGLSLPFGAITQTDFEARFQPTLEKIQAVGPGFSPLDQGYYFGPPLNEFLVLVMTKPQ